MASYFPEGECFFVRSSLKYGNNWSADNAEQFYSHVLIEYQVWPSSSHFSSKPQVAQPFYLVERLGRQRKRRADTPAISN